MKRRRPPAPVPGEPPEGFVAIARILSARGVRGEVNIAPLAGRKLLAPGRSVRVGGQDSRIERVGGVGRLYLKLEGTDDRETAATLRDEYLLIREDDLEPLPEGEFYRFQLVGLQVRTTGGRDLGRITDIIATRENDVFVVKGTDGENLIPVIEDVVLEVDIGRGTVTIEDVPGLLKD